MNETVEELERRLADLRAYHKAAWEEYGSELCAGDMLRQERELEVKIEQRKRQCGCESTTK